MLKNLIYLGCLFLIGCKNDTQSNTFEIPKIIQLDKHDTVDFLHPQGILGVYPIFINKFKFSKELQMNFDSFRISQSKIDTADFAQEGWQWHKFDSLSYDGFQVITDYNTDIQFSKYKEYEPYHHVFPVYIVNETKKNKLLIAKDSWVFAIQEAKDREGYWKVIEMDGFDWCGNGSWRLKIHPNEFGMFLMKKYKGDFKTQLRVRLRIGETTYISQPYDGCINEIQFLPLQYPK